MKKLIYLFSLIAIGQVNAQALKTGKYIGVYSYQYDYSHVNAIELYVFNGLNKNNDSIYNIIYSIHSKNKTLQFMYADGILNKNNLELTMTDKLYFQSTIGWPYQKEFVFRLKTNSNDVSMEGKSDGKEGYVNYAKVEFKTSKIENDIMQLMDSVRAGKITQEIINRNNSYTLYENKKQKDADCAGRPKGSRVAYQDLDLSNYEEIRIYPKWIYEAYENSNMGWGPSKVTKFAMTPFCQEWLDKFNNLKTIKATYGELLYWRASVDDQNAVVLIQKSKLPYFEELKRQTKLSLLTSSFFLSKISPLKDVEHALAKNPSFTKKLINCKYLEKYLKINFDYGMIPYNADTTLGLNGSYNVQFYTNGSEQPVAFFQGKFINGVPNGYCILTYLNPNRNFFSNYPVNLPFMGRFIFITGLWKNGFYQDECETLGNQYSFAKEKISKLFQVSVDTTKIKINVLCQLYNEDWFFPNDLTNDFNSVFEVRWPYEVQNYPRSKGFWDPVSSTYNLQYDSSNVRTHYAIFQTRGKDFYDRNLEFKLLQTEPELFNKYQKANPGKNDFVENFMFSKSKKYFYDDYTFIRISADYPFNHYYCTKAVQREVNGIWQTETEREWKENYCRDIEISRRTKRSDPLKVVKRVTVGDYNEDCDGTFLGDLFRKQNLYFLKNNDLAARAGDSYNQVIEQLVGEVQSDYPVHVPDNSITPEENLSNNKTSAIISRFKNSKLYDFNSHDTLSGAWLVRTSKLGKIKTNSLNDFVILIIGDKKGACYILNLDAMNPEKNYAEEIKQHGLIIENSNLLKIDGIPVSIKKLEKDQVIFDGYETWKRL